MLLDLSPALGYALMWAAFACYLAVLRFAGRIGRGSMWAMIIALLAVFACLPPILSHDVYSYIDYARLGAVHGIDPYLRGPAAVPGDLAFDNVGWPHIPSAYGPLFTLLSYPLAALPGGLAVYVVKVFSAASVLAIAVIVSRLATRRGIEPLGAAAFVALNPLVLVHVVGGPHNDALAVLVMMAGVAAVLAERPVAAGASFVFAAGVKVSAGFVSFALLVIARQPSGREESALRGRSRVFGAMLSGALLAMVVSVLCAYLGFGWSWL